MREPSPPRSDRERYDGWAAALHATWTGLALYVIGDCKPGGLAVILVATTGLQRAWDVMAVKRSGDATGLEEAPHYHGRRERLRARFREADSDAVTDYELLELVLFRAMPRRDIKPLAKSLIGKFGSFAETIAASPQRLAEVAGLGDAAITELKVVEAAAHRLARGEVKRRAVLGSWSAVLDYCRAAMAFADKEQFRILFLDKRNQLIADEVQQVGTVDHTPVYPREVVQRALELSATAVILVHNHPSGDPTSR